MRKSSTGSRSSLATHALVHRDASSASRARARRLERGAQRIERAWSRPPREVQRVARRTRPCCAAPARRAAASSRPCRAAPRRTRCARAGAPALARVDRARRRGWRRRARRRCGLVARSRMAHGSLSSRGRWNSRTGSAGAGCGGARAGSATANTTSTCGIEDRLPGRLRSRRRCRTSAGRCAPRSAAPPRRSVTRPSSSVTRSAERAPAARVVEHVEAHARGRAPGGPRAVSRTWA